MLSRLGSLRLTVHTLFVSRPKPMGLTYGVKDKPSNYSAWLHFNKQDVSVRACVRACMCVRVCMCVCKIFRQKIEDLEAERQRLEEQNNILEMRLERHNLQVGTESSLQLFSVMDLVVWHKGTNLITPMAAALPV